MSCCSLNSASSRCGLVGVYVLSRSTLCLPCIYVHASRAEVPPLCCSTVSSFSFEGGGLTAGGNLPEQGRRREPLVPVWDQYIIRHGTSLVCLTRFRTVLPTPDDDATLSKGMQILSFTLNMQVHCNERGVGGGYDYLASTLLGTFATET